MDKSTAITLLFLLNRDLSHLMCVEDFVKQFDVVEEKVVSILQQMESKE